MRKKRSLAAFEDEVIEHRQAHVRANTPGYLPHAITGRTFATGFRDYGDLMISGILASALAAVPMRKKRMGQAMPENLPEEKAGLEILNINEKWENPYKDPWERNAPLDSIYGNDSLDKVIDWRLVVGVSVLNALGIYSPEGPDITNARDHLKNNRQAYIALALAEAYADGVEINLDPSVIVTSVRLKPEPALPQA